jgi:O-antigen/teichoic acid export membrane protein
MASTKTNIIANFSGKIWQSFINIAFVPLYLNYLTVETFGIIGIFASLQAIMSLLDVGLGPALGREISRLSVFPDKVQEMRNLVRTIELPYWAISVFIGIISVALSPLIAHYWVNPKGLTEETVSECLIIMSVGFAFQWASNLALGGLIALQRQVLLNWMSAVFQTIRSVGAVVVLIFISPTIQAFLVWQTIWGIITTIVTITMFWRCMPPGEKPTFELNLLKSIWKYAAGMLGIGFVSLILTQLDKIILSKMLTLEIFGFYTLANTVASMGLGMIVNSISTVYSPQFAQRVALNDDKGLREIYHKSSQIMSVFLIPAMAIMIAFSYQIMFVWTNKENVATNTYRLLALAAIGTGCNGLMHIPYFVQLAHGYTKFAFWQNVVMVIVLMPSMIYLCFHYGAVGGAATWALLNFLYVVVGMQVMNLLIMKGELKRWYIEDIGKPLIVAASMAFLGKFIFPKTDSRLYLSVSLFLVSIFALLATMISTTSTRQQMKLIFNKFYLART